jgi:hypothetical protein
MSKSKTKDFFQSLLFWRGRKKGIIHTRGITLDDIRSIFFPKNFYEKYSYLGSIPWKEEGDIFTAIKPLVLLMDLEAKPWWCPRWFLRFLNLFGDDKSVVRVRNRFLSNLKRRITKGILMWDWKTKWNSYDLRLSISAPEYLQNLADDIEYNFYRKGRREEMVFELSNTDLVSAIDLDLLPYCDLVSLYNKHFP